MNVNYESPYTDIIFDTYKDEETYCPFCGDGLTTLYFDGLPQSANPYMSIIAEECYLKIEHKIKNEELLKLMHLRFYLGLDDNQKEIFCNLLSDEIEKAKQKIIKIYKTMLRDRYIIDVDDLKINEHIKNEIKINSDKKMS